MGGAMAVLSREELEKMTAIKLRELCQAEYKEIVGVSGMKKEQIVEAIIGFEVEKGLRPKEDKAAAKPSAVATLKNQVKGLKGERAKALEARDQKNLQAVRAQIKQAKRKMRRLKDAS
jgi:hypothetical protein